MGKKPENIQICRLPAPEVCGFKTTFEDGDLIISIRKTFDQENRGGGWAQIIIDTHINSFEMMIIDFGKNELISSTVYAGMIELYNGFQQRCTHGIHLRNCSHAIVRNLGILQITDLFASVSLRPDLIDKK